MNGRIGGVLNTSKSGLWTPEEHLYDVNGIRTGVTPRYGSYLNPVPIICGVQDTGTRSTDGAGLRHVTVASPLQAATLDTAYFDEHPLFNFPDWTDASGNVFCEIPIAYWWRGNLPDVVDGTTPRWTMLMNIAPGTVNIGGTECEFKASDATYKRGETYLDSFYIGKYRGHNAGSNKVGSKAGQTAWTSVNFDNFRTYCSNNGVGYHMLSLFEWHEILARMTIEKKTFQLMPESIRATQASCVYRGIEDFAFGPTSGVCAERMDGIRTNASGNYELWSSAGGSYVTTSKKCSIYSEESYYTQSLFTGMDNLFISDVLGPNSTSFIPDMAGGRGSGLVSCICTVFFHASYVYYGAFDSYFSFASSKARDDTGCRLAKW